jgi:hypothetical protein
VTESEAPAIEWATLTLDLEAVTIGEMAAIEAASGRDFLRLLSAGAASRRLIALYLIELRHSEPRRSWSELSSLRPLGSGSLTSPSRRDGRRASVSG